MRGKMPTKMGKLRIQGDRQREKKKDSEGEGWREAREAQDPALFGSSPTLAHAQGSDYIVPGGREWNGAVRDLTVCAARPFHQGSSGRTFMAVLPENGKEFSMLNAIHLLPFTLWGRHPLYASLPNHWAGGILHPRWYCSRHNWGALIHWSILPSPQQNKNNKLQRRLHRYVHQK